MLALWRLGKRATTEQVMESLAEVPPRDYRTIRTLLERCVEKGWAKEMRTRRSAPAEGRGKGRPPTIYYAPRVLREVGFREVIESFVLEGLEVERDPEALEALEEAIRRIRRRLSGKRGKAKKTKAS